MSAEWVTPQTRAFVRLPSEYGDFLVDVDAIVAIVSNKGVVLLSVKGVDPSLLTTTATVDEVVEAMHEAFVASHTIGGVQ